MQRLFSNVALHLSAILIIAAFTILRLLVAPHFGLGSDEAHYALYGQFLDWSYFDHPPLVGWIHAAFSSVLGTSEFVARLPAIIISAITSFLVYIYLLHIEDNKVSAIAGMVALNCSFIYCGLSFMFLPDTILLPLYFLIAILVVEIADNPSLGKWGLLGVFLGLAGLAKYTAVLFLIPITIFFITKLRFRFLASKNLYIGALIGLVFVLPVLYWNMANDFISFKYQSNHVLGERSFNLKAIATSFGSQFLGYNPLLVVLSLWGFVRAFFSTNDYIRIAWLFGATMLAFFGYASLMDTTLPHWSIGFYLFFIPISVYYLTRQPGKGRKIAYLFIAASLPMVIFLHAELAIKFLPMPDYKSMHRDIYGWPEIMKTATEIVDADSAPLKGMAVTNWSLGSRAIYYSGIQRRDVFVIDKRFDQFDLWQLRDPSGFDLLFINTHDFYLSLASQVRCEKIEPVKETDLTLNKRKVNTVQFSWCRGYLGLN